MNSYEAHENEYARMKKAGIRSWDCRGGALEIDPNDERFFEDVFAQKWMPSQGRLLELGCGTGPILRMLCSQGFRGVGIDVSKTAIAMAREQSKGLDVSFRVGDVCSLAESVKGKFDVVVDGHAIHCITAPNHRVAAFEGIRDCLRESGIFILMTMCAPVLRKTFSRLYPDQVLVGGTIHVPCQKENGYSDLREISGKSYLPTRRIENWTTLLRQLRDVGFQPMLLRFNHCAGDEAISTLNAAFKISKKD